MSDPVQPANADDLFHCHAQSKVVTAQSIADLGGGGGSGPKIYRALLSQSGTDAPIATVLENTLGGVPVWTCPSAAVYDCVLAGAFPLGKVAHSSHIDFYNSIANKCRIRTKR